GVPHHRFRCFPCPDRLDDFLGVGVELAELRTVLHVFGGIARLQGAETTAWRGLAEFLEQIHHTPRATLASQRPMAQPSGSAILRTECVSLPLPVPDSRSPDAFPPGAPVDRSARSPVYSVEHRDSGR